MVRSLRRKLQQRYIAGCGDCFLCTGDPDRHLKGGSNVFRIVGFLGWAKVFAEKLIADEFSVVFYDAVEGKI